MCFDRDVQEHFFPLIDGDVDVHHRHCRKYSSSIFHLFDKLIHMVSMHRNGFEMNSLASERKEA